MIPSDGYLDTSRTGREAQELETKLRRYVVGQDEAIKQIVNVYQMHLIGMNMPGRPVGSFLLLGPTGSGKTRLVEALAENLVGDSDAVIKIDCAEFQHSHEIAKLIGSPPGYLGHRETSPALAQERLDRRHTETCKVSFVLFDEIEKASDALWNLLLGILDKAVLTLGDNRRVDFSRAMVFMTSNLGAAEMSDLVAPKFGFQKSEAERVTAAPEPSLSGKLTAAALNAVRKKFTPEFVNRIDKMVVFNSLSQDDLARILDIELAFVQQRILVSGAFKPFLFDVTPAAKQLLINEGTDSRYGARELKRAINRLMVQPLANVIATQQLNGDAVRVDVDPEEGCLLFLKEARRKPQHGPNAVSESGPHVRAAALGASGKYAEGIQGAACAE